MERWATFDCYGTLVDWNAGIAAALGDASLLERYHELEPWYRPRTRTPLPRRAPRDGAPPGRGCRSGRVAAGLAGVPRGPGRARGGAPSRLAARDPLDSDRDLIEASIEAIGVPFDLAIVASEIGSYKPAHDHWHAFADAVGDLPDVHVAQSRFHDVAPATALGIPTIWINRLSESGDAPPSRELPSLHGLADALDRVAPAA